MPRIADPAQAVTGGVDTHAEVNVAAVVDAVGRVLGTEEFPTTAGGDQAVLAWMRRHGRLVKVGVEGTGSYGAGLARYLAAQGVEVVPPQPRWPARGPPNNACAPGSAACRPARTAATSSPSRWPGNWPGSCGPK